MVMLHTRLLLLSFVALASAFALTPRQHLVLQHGAPAPAPLLRASAQHQRAPHRLRTTTSLMAAATQPPAGVSVTAAIINLSKNIVGSGVLALAAGVAAFSSSKVALLPAFAILLPTGIVSAYTFSSIARVGAAVGGNSYRDTWAKVFGEKTAILPDVTVIFMTMAAAICYSIIVGDSFASIAKLVGAPALLTTPNAWIVLLSAFVLLPLSLLRDLSKLAIGSVIGTAGTLYTALFMFLRLLDGSYAPGGKYFAAISAAAQPAFAAHTVARPLLNTGMFVLLSMLASAYLAHYNAPKFYEDLQPPADGSSKLPRFNTVCLAGFGGAAALMGSIMAFGFLTFGGASQGLILNNYATADPLAGLARLGIALSIIFSYPLNMTGLREGILAMFGQKAAGAKATVHVLLTLALVLILNGSSLFIKDLGLIVGLGGAILGSALVYIFPALMAIGETKGAMSPMEKKVNWGLTGLGVFFAILGAVMCLK
jgi:sodium-coupled neutral amino acid transporter 11